MMWWSTHVRTQRLVERLLVRGLAPRAHGRLRDHLRDCAGCRAYYQQAREIENALFDDAPVNDAAMARLRDLVVPAPRRLSLRMGALLAGAFATAALVVAIVPRIVEDGQATGRDDSLDARGGITAQPAAALTLFRVDPARGQVARVQRTGGIVPIKAGAMVQLAYSNGEYRHLVVVGVDARWAMQWYHPTTAGSAMVQTDRVDEPMGEAWRITAAPGLLRLYALFSAAPLAPEAVSRAVEAVRRDAGSLREARELPGLGAHQDSLLLEVQP